MLTTEFKLASSKSQCVSASEATWGYGGDVMRSGWGIVKAKETGHCQVPQEQINCSIQFTVRDSAELERELSCQVSK